MEVVDLRRRGTCESGAHAALLAAQVLAALQWHFGFLARGWLPRLSHLDRKGYLVVGEAVAFRQNT